MHPLYIIKCIQEGEGGNVIVCMIEIRGRRGIRGSTMTRMHMRWGPKKINGFVLT